MTIPTSRRKSLYIVTSMIFALFTGNLYALPPLKVVQIGDSYSAGNGARSASGEKNYNGVDGCYRSPTNWGNRFVESLKDSFSVTYVNRACSGALIKNIVDTPETLQTKIGLDTNRAWLPCPKPEYPEEEWWDCNQDDPDSDPYYYRKVLNQIYAIDESVDLVLLSIGGNDLGFNEIVKQCFVTGLRDAGSCEVAVNDANDQLTNLPNLLKNTFDKLRDELRADARVVYVAYPHLVPDVDYALNRLGPDVFVGPPYPAGDKIRELAEKGELVQKAAVQEANARAQELGREEFIVYYDGTKDLFEGHLPEPFQSKNRNPDTWLHEFDTFTKMEWYHYNNLGHENLGLALAPFETFGATGGIIDTKTDVDVAFIVDTTGSMGGQIADVQTQIGNLVAQLAADTTSYRAAVISYRDFPERTGDPGDYPSRVDQNFSNDLEAIQAAINGLSASGGGDGPETVFSGISTALNLDWRPGVTKLAIVIGDAPALSPEPISGLTKEQLVADSIAIDPVQVIGINVGSLDDNGAIGEIGAGTGGAVISSSGGLTQTIKEVLEYASKKPFAWIGQAYSGKIGAPISFDASGSFDPSGEPLTSYEWDFDSDGNFDLTTTESQTTHIYNAKFNDFLVLRVTGKGGTALASARVLVNQEGYASQGDEEPCELDDNGISIIVDENSQFIRCTPDSLPDSDQAEAKSVNCDIDMDGRFNWRDLNNFSTGCLKAELEKAWCNNNLRWTGNEWYDKRCPEKEAPWLCDINQDGKFNWRDANEYQKACKTKR